MTHPKITLAGFALATVLLVACQPKEGPAERAGKAVDNSVSKAASSMEEAGDKIHNKVDDAKK